MAAVGSGGANRDIVWLTRQGQREPASSVAQAFRPWYPALVLSPDGARAAAEVVGERGSGDIWVATFASNTLTRLSFGGAKSPVWTPDGSRICFVSSGEAFCQAADGSGKPVSLFKSPGMNNLEFSPDGSRLVFTAGGQDGNDILIATLGPPVEIRPLINTAFRDNWPAISPDGRWIAYTSTESGRSEVYVRPFPDVDRGRWQVSTDGGMMPRWAKNGRELIFRRGANPVPEFWASAIQPGTSFVAGAPTQIAAGPLTNISNAYDVAADGRLLVTVPTDAEASRARIVVVQNWFDELKARVPVTPRKVNCSRSFGLEVHAVV
jgi:serine/threonine-protein kinase